MQCDNCGYIFFQPSKKCACCSAPYVPAQSAFDVGQENLFTVFEMAPGEGGIPGGMGVTGANTGIEDYNFTDDFDTGGTEYGVDENVLDLSDAEAEGFGIPAATGPMGVDEFEFDTSAMDDMPSGENAGDDFELNLSDSLLDNETDTTETLAPEVDLDNADDMAFTGGFDEVEGLGFGEFDESAAEGTPEEATEEISLGTAPEPEISLEPELELPEEETEQSEEPSLELTDDPALDIGEMDAIEEDPSLELLEDLELSEEPELMDASMEESAETEDEGGIDFDLDSVDLDVPEEVSYEVPEADEEPETEAGGEESFMDLEGLELEMETPEEPEDEDLKQ